MKKQETGRFLLLIFTLILLINTLNASFVTTLEEVSNSKTAANDDLVVKIHKHGDSFHDEQKLVWSPNDLIENRLMQISVYADGLFDTSNIQSVNIQGTYNGEIRDVLTFEFTSTEFIVDITDSGLIVSLDYEYDNQISHGNYTITANLSNVDGTFSKGNSSRIYFTEYDFMIYSDNPAPRLKMCACEAKYLNVTILNTGEIERGFVVEYQYVKDTNAGVNVSPVRGNTSNNRGNNVFITGGQSLTINLILTPTTLFDNSTQSKKEPLDIQIYYEDDDGNNITLYSGIYTLNIKPYLDYESPQILVTTNRFGYEKSFDGSYDATDSQDIIYTLGNNWLIANYTISNVGYYNTRVSLFSNTSMDDVRVIYEGQNLSLTDFYRINIELNSDEKLNLAIYLNFPTNLDNLEFNLTVDFGNSQKTDTKLKLSSEPLSNNLVISSAKQNYSFDSIDSAIEILINLNTASYSNYNFFENTWVLTCLNSDNVSVKVVNLSVVCDSNGIPLPAGVNTTYNLEVMVENWNPTNTQNVTMILMHNPANITSLIDKRLTLYFDFSPSENNSSNGDSGSNSNNNSENNNQNNTGDTNNQNDTDNDGIIDMLDNCLDSKSGETVDEFGCSITETNIDNTQQNDAEQQQNSDNSASKSDETNVLLYAVIGLIIIAILGGILVIRSRSSAKPNNLATSTVANPVMPPIVMPLAPLEPVVLQQWTDANGYSWRQMSDQTIMWWNGTDWIPYGKN